MVSRFYLPRILGVLVLVLFSACGDRKNNDRDSNSSTTAPKPPVLTSISAFGNEVALGFGAASDLEVSFQIFVRDASIADDSIGDSQETDFYGKPSVNDDVVTQLTVPQGPTNQTLFVRARTVSNISGERSVLSNELSVQLLSDVALSAVESAGTIVNASWNAQPSQSYKVAYASAPFVASLDNVSFSDTLTESPAVIDVVTTCPTYCYVAVVAIADNSMSRPLNSISGRLVSTMPIPTETIQRVEGADVVFELVQTQGPSDSMTVWVGTQDNLTAQTAATATVTDSPPYERLRFLARFPLDTTTDSNGDRLTYYYMAQSSVVPNSAMAWVSKSPVPTEGSAYSIDLDFPAFVLRQSNLQPTWPNTVNNLQRQGDKLYWTNGEKISATLHGYNLDDSELPSERKFMHANLIGFNVLVDSSDDSQVYYSAKRTAQGQLASRVFLKTSSSVFEATVGTADPDTTLFLTQDATHVFGHTRGHVFRITKAGFSNATTQELATCPAPTTIRSMAMNESTVYFGCAGSSMESIWSVSKTGTNLTEETSAYGATAMAWDDANSRLVFANANTQGLGPIYSISLSSPTPFAAPTVVVAQAANVTKMQVHGEILYYLGGAQLRSINLGGGPIRRWPNSSKDFLVTNVPSLGEDSYLYMPFSNGYGLARFPADYGENLVPMTEEVTELIATSKDGEVELKWRAVEGAGSYKIYADESTEPLVELPYNLTRLPASNGAQHTYLVKAVAEDGSLMSTGASISATPRLGPLYISLLQSNIAMVPNLGVGWFNPNARDSLTLKLWRLPHGDALDINATADVTLTGVLGEGIAGVGNRNGYFGPNATGYTFDLTDAGALYDYHIEMRDGDSDTSYVSTTFMPYDTLSAASSEFVSATGGGIRGNQLATAGGVTYTLGVDGILYSGDSTGISQDSSYVADNTYAAIASDGTHVVWAGSDSIAGGLFEVGTGTWSDVNPRSYGDLAYVGETIWAATDTVAARVGLYALDFSLNDNKAMAYHAYGAEGIGRLIGYGGTAYFIQGSGANTAIYALASGDTEATLVANVASAIDIATDGSTLFVSTSKGRVHKIILSTGAISAFARVCMGSGSGAGIAMQQVTVGQITESFLYGCFVSSEFVSQLGRVSVNASAADEGLFVDSLNPLDITTVRAGIIRNNGLWLDGGGLWLSLGSSALYRFEPLP